MNNAHLRQVINSLNQLLIESASFFFLKFSLGCYVGEQLTIAAVLHDDEQVSRRLYYLVELDDVRVSH